MAARQPTLQRTRRGGVLGLAEVAEQERKKRARTRRAKSKPNREGWQHVQPEDGKWHFQAPRTPTKGAMLRDVPRHHSLSEVFLLLLTPAVLVACREELSSDTTGLSLAHVYKAMAVDILIRAERDMQPHLRLRGHRRSTPHRQKHPLEQVFKHLKERHKLEGLGFKKWQRVRNGVYHARCGPNEAITVVSLARGPGRVCHNG